MLPRSLRFTWLLFLIALLAVNRFAHADALKRMPVRRPRRSAGWSRQRGSSACGSMAVSPGRRSGMGFVLPLTTRIGKKPHSQQAVGTSGPRQLLRLRVVPPTDFDYARAWRLPRHCPSDSCSRSIYQLFWEWDGGWTPGVSMPPHMVEMTGGPAQTFGLVYPQRRAGCPFLGAATRIQRGRIGEAVSMPHPILAAPRRLPPAKQRSIINGCAVVSLASVSPRCTPWSPFSA